MLYLKMREDLASSTI